MSEDKIKGRAKGGVARAESLTPERRKEIAQNAAMARHQPAIPKATHKGVLKVGDLELPCFVLDDGRRVISGRGMTAAIGMKGRGQGIARIAGHRIMEGPHNSALVVAIQTPIKFSGGCPGLAHLTSAQPS